MNLNDTQEHLYKRLRGYTYEEVNEYIRTHIPYVARMSSTQYRKKRLKVLEQLGWREEDYVECVFAEARRQSFTNSSGPK